MNRLSIMFIVVLLVIGAQAIGAQQNTAALDKLFASAQHKATVDGDLKGAIEDYKRIVDRAGSNRALAAQALLRMAEAYDTLGDTEAQKIYQRVVSGFSDQRQLAASARSRLDPKANLVAAATLKDVADLNASGNVTSDGRYATSVNWETGNITVRDLYTGATRAITTRSDYAVYDPAISRDGKFVAYQSYNGCVERKPSKSSNGVLCLIAVEGEPANTSKTVLDHADIRNIRPLDWAPDGRSIAVTLHRLDGAAQIGIVNVADGTLAVLQSTDWRGATRIFFSPDGRYIAFDVPVNDTSDDLDVRVIAVDGTEGSTAIHDPSQNLVMGWAPDGRDLLFASDRSGTMDLWAQRVTNAKAEGAARLVHPGLGGALSLGLTRTGSLYFGTQSGDRDIEVLTLDLKAGTTLSSPGRPISRYVGTNAMPEWSRDGRFMAYVSQRGALGNERIIGIRESSTGAIRELRPKVTYIEGLSWAPDGNKIVTNATDFKGRSGVFMIDVRNGEMSFLGPGRFPKFAPDGNRIFYATPGATPNSLVVRNLTSGAERTIITGEFATFTVSPDGRLLAVARGGISGASAQEVVIVDADTGQARQIYRVQQGHRVPPYIGLPFTPDGEGVLLRKRTPNEELWLVPIHGGEPRKIEAAIAGWTFGSIGSISLHPDGRQLVGTALRENRIAEVRVLENFLPATNR